MKGYKIMARCLYKDNSGDGYHTRYDSEIYRFKIIAEAKVKKLNKNKPSHVDYFYVEEVI